MCELIELIESVSIRIVSFLKIQLMFPNMIKGRSTWSQEFVSFFFVRTIFPHVWLTKHRCHRFGSCVWATHTYNKRREASHIGTYIDSFIICYVCEPDVHIIRDYKRSNPRVNVWLALLLYVRVTHTHELNPNVTSY